MLRGVLCDKHFIHNMKFVSVGPKLTEHNASKQSDNPQTWSKN